MSEQQYPAPDPQDPRPAVAHPGRVTEPGGLDLLEAEAVTDLERYAGRARTASDTGVRLQVAGTVLAAWTSVLHPRGLGDGVPVVLGLRTFRLRDGNLDGTDAVFPLSSITERTARMTSTGSTVLTLPPVTETASWTAVTPPRSGWQSVAEVEDAELQQIAREGIRELGEALPKDPGASMVAQARSAVWGRLLGGSGAADGTDGFLPAGAAFAAHSLGFLREGGLTAVHTTGPWVRLSSRSGFVLSRQPMRL